jgi:predicted nucleotidyltransferase
VIAAVESKSAEVAELCARHRVRRLWAFGSAAAGRFDPATSDLDLLVEFGPMSPAEHAESYFCLMEDLEQLLGMAVDLVEDEAIRNPYFRRALDATRVVLYEAA